MEDHPTFYNHSKVDDLKKPDCDNLLQTLSLTASLRVSLALNNALFPEF
jgi:hypothetical protein